MTVINPTAPRHIQKAKKRKSAGKAKKQSASVNISDLSELADKLAELLEDDTPLDTDQIENTKNCPTEDADPFEDLLNRIKDIPLLSREAENELGQTLLKAQEELVDTALRIPSVLTYLAKVYSEFGRSRMIIRGPNREDYIIHKEGKKCGDNHNHPLIKAKRQEISNKLVSLCAMTDAYNKNIDRTDETRNTILNTRQEVRADILTLFPPQKNWDVVFTHCEKNAQKSIERKGYYPLYCQINDIKNHIHDAQGILFERNLRFASYLLHFMTRDREIKKELLPVACIGLMNAVQRFDCRLSKLTTLASSHIKAEVLAHLNSKSRLVYLPRTALDKIEMITAARKEILNKTGFEPDLKTLVKRTGVKAEIINELKVKTVPPHSLNEPVTDHRGSCEGTAKTTMMDNLVSETESEEEKITRGQISACLSELIGSLKPREEKIIRHYFGVGAERMKTQELADLYGVRHQRVTQIKEQALDTLFSEAWKKPVLREYARELVCAP